VSNQITLLILCYISSRAVTLVKVIYIPVHISDFLVLTLSFKFTNLSFQIFLVFVPKMSASFTSYIV
jgi:hypothetical protein